MNKHIHRMALLLCLAGVLAVPLAGAQTGIINTKHNLSKSGPGDIRALDEDRICVFCHTPHNAIPRTPLWNKSLKAVNYTPYSSSTMIAVPTLPSGPSRLCLSCHDGTIALGEVLRPSTLIAMTVTGGLPSQSSAYLGTSLSGDHPVSFSYFSSTANAEIAPTPPSKLLFYGNGFIHCTTCHDPHDNTNKKFLAVNNENSGLCVLCHAVTGWDGSSHKTEQSTWNGTDPNPWPRTGITSDFGWTTVRQNGCENCHDPHNAVGQQRLLNCYTATGNCSPATEEGNCLPCHNGNMIPATKNIMGQLKNVSRHAVDLTTGVHDPKEHAWQISNHVECVDCHNSHMTNKNKTAIAPFVSGRLDGVSGVTLDNAVIKPAVYEYEICFKCHASASALSLFLPIPRVAKEVNTRLAFQTSNASFHPVVGQGASSDVPSLIVTLTTTSRIYCTDCHSDESTVNGGTGSRGPHGSQYAPILREKYKTTFDTLPYSYSSFALCYSCHYESSILSDNTFQRSSLTQRGGHSGHLGYLVNAPCSACHDPHGVRDDGGVTGSHKRLINFDTRIVTAMPGSGFTVPVFAGSGNRKGNCALVCHDANGKEVIHDGSTTFSYGGYGTIGYGTIKTIW
jgi:predicted CXXCH cytochrome family protein